MLNACKTQTIDIQTEIRIYILNVNLHLNDNFVLPARITMYIYISIKYSFYVYFECCTNYLIHIET